MDSPSWNFTSASNRGIVVIVVVFRGFGFNAQLYTELPSPRKGQGHPVAMANRAEGGKDWVFLQTSAHLLLTR